MSQSGQYTGTHSYHKTNLADFFHGISCTLLHLYFATAFARVECLGSCGLSKRAELHCKKLSLASKSDIPAGDGKNANLFLQCNNFKSPNVNAATQREERLKEEKADSILPMLATSGTV
jgi:hypothetical protein